MGEAFRVGGRGDDEAGVLGELIMIMIMMMMMMMMIMIDDVCRTSLETGETMTR